MIPVSILGSVQFSRSAERRGRTGAHGGEPARPARSLKTRQHAGLARGELAIKPGRRFGPGRPHEDTGSDASVRMLPRKEVIQPHLPVRLPCYDFTPVTGPTFDGSLPCGLGHRLRVLPIPVV